MSMEREWEKFKGGPTVAKQNRLHVTMDRKGVIFMNGNMHRVLGKPAAVALYYNREKDMIAVEPANPRLEQNFPVRQKASGWVICASPFCRHFGIRLSATENFVRPDLDKAGVFLLSLGDTVTVARTRPHNRLESA